MEKSESADTSILFRKGWKIVFSYLGEYRREVVILSVLGIFSALANGAVPYLVGTFFDAVIAPERLFTLFEYTLPLWQALLGGWFLVQVIANGSDYVIDRIRRRVGTHINASFVSTAASTLLTLPISFHKEHRHGDTWDRVMRARQALTQIIEQVVIQIAPQLLSVLIGFVFAFSISPLLAGILVLGVVIYVLTLIKVVAPIAKLQEKGYRAWSDAFGDAYDAIANYETVKQATAEEFERKHLTEKFVKKAFGIWYKVEKIWSNINFYQRVVVIGTQLTIFIIAAFYIHQGDLTVGGLIALNGYAAMVFAPFATLGYKWESLQNGLVAIERAQDILDTEPENTQGHVKKHDISGKVEFNDVSFSYAEDSGVLHDINFEVNPGDVVAFVGESGVGKSTAISLISGYYFPTNGEVRIDDVSTKEIDLKHLRSSIAVVPQEVVLFNDTIEANIRYGQPDASDEEVRSAAKKAHVDVFVEKFDDGYEQLVGERGVKLSVGEKQRVAIARAILRDPKILILDEPTSALDVQTEFAITESLDELMKDRTTFIIAHRLSTVRRADQILVFNGGRVVERGTHDELLEKEDGVYRQLHDLHIGLRE
ncbi:MAG: ABC transporter ATP-binding protein [Candidatus Paceibacterota bacterium]